MKKLLLIMLGFLSGITLLVAFCVCISKKENALENKKVETTERIDAWRGRNWIRIK